MPLTTSLSLDLRGTQTGTLDLGTVNATLRKLVSDTLASGTGADQADLMWTDQRTVANGANDDIDLAGTLPNAIGGNAVFATIKAILIYAASANGDEIVVGNHATAAFVGPFGAATHTVKVEPDGVFFWWVPGTGYAVTATTADILRINNPGAGSATYDIVVVGTTA